MIISHCSKGTILLGVALFVFGYLFSRLPNQKQYRLPRSWDSKVVYTNIPEWQRSLMICPEVLGRFGNQMFEYASSYGIARTLGRQLVIPWNDGIRHTFKLSTAIVIGNRTLTCNRWRSVHVGNVAIYDEHIYQTVQAVQNNVLLRNYMQSWKYFDKYRKDIREEFTITNRTIIEQAQTIINKAKEKFYPDTVHVTYVGLHIRRGSLKMNASLRLGYNVAPGHYVREAIRYTQSRYPNVLFLACTQDIGWTNREITSQMEIALENVYNDVPQVDFAVLVACNHTIMTVGTFGWWAGYLSGGQVLYYKYPIRDHTKLAVKYNFTDHFPPHWLGLG